MCVDAGEIAFYLPDTETGHCKTFLAKVVSSHCIALMNFQHFRPVRQIYFESNSFIHLVVLYYLGTFVIESSYLYGTSICIHVGMGELSHSTFSTIDKSGQSKSSYLLGTHTHIHTRTSYGGKI